MRSPSLKGLVSSFVGPSAFADSALVVAAVEAAAGSATLPLVAVAVSFAGGAAGFDFDAESLELHPIPRPAKNMHDEQIAI